MLSHEKVWAAIDALAARHSLSASGLAKKAGLDSTAFNRSKRYASDGRPRWPSTESIAKVVDATGESLSGFAELVDGTGKVFARRASVPLIGFAQAGAGGFFTDSGFPVGQGWEEIALPGQVPDGAYALQVQGDSMLPLYRDGDVLVVDPAAKVRRGDRVVVRTVDGEVMAKVLERQTALQVELLSVNPEHPDRTFVWDELDWMVRIVWATQ